MKLNNKEIDTFVESLHSRHGFKFDEFVRQSKKLTTHIKGLRDFSFTEPDSLLEIPHVGRVVVDAVLQVGHNYEKQVRKRVEHIIGYDEAATISGFLRILNQFGLEELLDWNSPAIELDFLDVGKFFGGRGIETYSELKEWLKPEENRDSLLSQRSGLGGRSIFRVGDKTADYFRVLVCQWNSVAVDSNIRAMIRNAEIMSRYAYKEIRTIVQLSALEFDLRPIDLDASIYNDAVVHRERYKGKMKRRPYGTGARYGREEPSEGGSVMVDSMPKRGDMFMGKINDLCLRDAKGWERRDIWFFKQDIHRHEKFGYPTRYSHIILIDTDGDRCELNFSKPDLQDKVCLGTPSRLKPWYRKKGFDNDIIDPNDRIYFEYTGQGNEFFILTEEEYNSRHREKPLT